MIDINQAGTLPSVLSRKAYSQPSEILYTFLSDGDLEETHLTYAQLDSRAHAIAAHLLQYAEPGDRALLLYQPGLDYICGFFGCLYAGIIAVPAYPPRNARNVPRIQVIAADAQARLCLTSSSILARSKELFGIISGLERLTWLATDTVGDEIKSNYQLIEPSPETVAYLQYTSGSTNNPKGVMVSHRNLIHNLSFLCDNRGHTKIVSWLPFFHDMGLIYGILQGLYGGFPCVLFAPASFLQKPVRWLNALSRHRASTAIAPNFAYELCTEKVTDAEKQFLDLSNWKMALNAAEPVRAETLRQFSDAFACCGFRAEFLKPSYGLAEATLGVSILKGASSFTSKVISKESFQKNRIVEIPTGASDAAELVGCGQWATDQAVVIANPETLTQCASNEVGEIWISGPSVAKGYWRRPTDTKETFEAFLADSRKGPFLRTGDLGFLSDGQLFITGRLKDLIIIRGANHYPQDIEMTVQKTDSALQSDAGAAFSIDVDGEEQLVIVQELVRHPKSNLDEVIEKIRLAISETHGLQVFAVALIRNHTIPKTTSGKIQRKLCRLRFLNDELDIIHHWHVSKVQHSSPGLEDLSPPPSDSNEKQVNEIINWLRIYAESRINSRIIDERRTIPPYIVLDFGNRGLLGMQIPVRYGGLGLACRDVVRIVEQVAAIDLTLGLLVSLNNTIGIRPIQNFATSEIQDKHLPLLAAGRELAAFALTEPGAGSNPRSISAIANRTRTGWKLNGTKIFSGSASWAGILNVFVKADISASSHILGFAIPQGVKGLRQGPEALTMGMRGMIQNTIHLDNVHVTESNLLGTPNNGFEVAQESMMFARLILGAMSLGGMKRCAQLITRYASRRTVQTGKLIENGIVLRRLNHLIAATTCLERLITRAASLIDQKKELPPEVFVVCKTAGAEFLWHAADDLTQALGGRGYIESNIAPQILRDARVMRVFEGPTETLNTYLGSRLIGQFSEFERFLTTLLKSPSIAVRLKELANAAKQRLFASKNFPDDQNSRSHWIYNLLGQAVSFGLLLAAVEHSINEKPSAELSHAAEWASIKFQEAIDRVIDSKDNALTIMAADVVTNHIGRYTDSIGNIEQELPHPDCELDTLLRNDIKNERPKFTSNQVQAQPDSRANPSSRSIRNWLIHRLAAKLSVSENLIDTSKPFSTYGIDSVTSVELAQELSEWLNQNLPSTIAWDYSSIDLLADYLADNKEKNFYPNHVNLSAATQPNVAKPGLKEKGLHSRSLADLNDEELASLLESELHSNRINQ